MIESRFRWPSGSNSNFSCLVLPLRRILYAVTVCSCCENEYVHNWHFNYLQRARRFKTPVLPFMDRRLGREEVTNAVGSSLGFPDTSWSSETKGKCRPNTVVHCRNSVIIIQKKSYNRSAGVSTTANHRLPENEICRD